LQINSVAKDTSYYYITFQKPKLLTKVRYIVVYAAKNSAKINTKDPSQIIDKIAVAEENNEFHIEIPLDNMIGKKTLAFTYVDYYANESAETAIDLEE
jgi:hypothetical protein